MADAERQIRWRKIGGLLVESAWLCPSLYIAIGVCERIAANEKIVEVEQLKRLEADQQRTTFRKFSPRQDLLSAVKLAVHMDWKLAFYWEKNRV